MVVDQTTIKSPHLSYTVRVRDLVHGFVYLIDLEVKCIDSRLFQRLRNVKQNDVASYVYPSLNSSRFEHSLGTASVAGRMALSLLRSPEWISYEKQVELSDHDFVQVCRLYALLHDVGHLPLSHLFELGLADFEDDRGTGSISKQWFSSEFNKPHEACGSMVTRAILDEIKPPPAIKNAVLHLTAKKFPEEADPFRPIKLLIDSEIDADRIDSTARDGLLSGGEYGTYDIERLCSSVFLQPHGKGWRLAYSNKALGSIEALLLDRYRTHTWIHFHHGVVTMKAAVRELIRGLLATGIITKDSFPVSQPDIMSLRDDFWLWSLFRNMDSPLTDGLGMGIRNFVLFRDKEGIALSWKTRTEYHQWIERLKREAGVRKITRFGPEYQKFLTEKLGRKVLVFWADFEPIGIRGVPLMSEDESEVPADLLKASPLLESLNNVWQHEPQFYVVFAGNHKRHKEYLEEWVKATAQWINQSGPTKRQ